MKDILIISIILGLSISATIGSSANDDSCTNNDHKISSDFPYWNGDQFPCMYAGTFKTNTTEGVDHNLFYWFFRNTSIQSNDTLILWMNGGPGTSGLYGMFLENGPLRISKGSGDDAYSIGLTKGGSWADLGHIIFLDQPVGVGFSYGDSYLDRMETGTLEMIQFIRQFKTFYPEFKNAKLILAGESYAGKYLPMLCAGAAIHDQRQAGLTNPADQLFVNTHAVLIGDPFNSPVRQRTSTHLVGKGLNVMDSSLQKNVAQLRRRCEKSVSTNWTASAEDCSETMDFLVNMGGSVNSYDVSMFTYDWDPKKKLVSDFLTNSANVKNIYKALHVDQSTKTPVFELSSDRVQQNYLYEEMLDWSFTYDGCLQTGYKVLMYSGEYDQRDGPLTQEEWLKKITRFDYSTPSKGIWNQARKIYYVKQGDDYIVGGYYREDSQQSFTLLTVPKSGHFVPATQLEVTKSFLNDYMTNGKLVCHKTDEVDCQTGPIMCSYMKNCSNQGTCDNTTGKCTCNSGYAGADCGEKVEVLTDGYSSTKSFNGVGWQYYQFSDNLIGDQQYNLTISTSNPSDIYISRGNKIPTEFSSDIEIKQKSYVIISSSTFPQLTKFTVGVRVNGFDSYSNMTYNSAIRSQFTMSQIQSSNVKTEETTASASENEGYFSGLFKKMKSESNYLWEYYFGKQ